MVFILDVAVKGFSQVSVQAETLEEAEEKASEAVMQYLVSDLRWKEVTYTNLTKE